MLTAFYLFAGFLVGFALVRVLFAFASRLEEKAAAGCKHVWMPCGEPVESRVWGNHGEEHPIAIVYRQSMVCLACNEMDYKERRIES